VSETETSAAAVRRSWVKYTFLGAAVGLVAVLGLFIYVSSDSFQSLVRRRLIEEVERITGGRAEIASIHTIPFRLQAEVRNITVHGRESSTDVPLAHADAIVGRLKISSLLRTELAFNQLILERPVVHVASYPDGTSNFPVRKSDTTSTQNPVEKLFALSIDHFELRHGQVLWDDQPVPVDFSAHDVSLQMDYSFLARRYTGRLLLGLVDTKLLDCRPFAWMTTMEFTLGANSAVISSLQWNSGHSHLSTTGQITDFRHPHFNGPYEAQLDLTEAANIARRHDLRSGIVQLKGHGDWSLDRFSTSGLLTVKDFGIQNDQINMARTSLTAGYTVTEQNLHLDKLEGKILGGSFAGDVEVDQWLTPPEHLSAAARKILETATISAARPRQNAARPTAAKAKSSIIQIGLIRIRLRDLSGEEIASALNTPAHPFPRFHPAALASGSFETRWKGTPQDADTEFTLDLNPPPISTYDQLAITAHANGIYHSATEMIDLPHFTLATPTSRVLASGTLSNDSALHLSASTSSLADWLPFVSAVRGPALFPVALNGNASFNGNMAGSLQSPRLTGALAINNFDITLPATTRTPPLKTHWDSLSSSLQLSFDSIALHNAKLQRDDSSAELEASAALEHGHLTGDSTFDLRAHLHDADLATLEQFSGWNYPVLGKADLFLQSTGTISNPHADGQIHLKNASAYGQTIREFDSSFHMDREGLALTDMHLSHDDAILTGSASYHPSNHAFTFDIQGKNLDLADIRQIQSNRLNLAGRADFALQGSGTPDAPSINGNVQIRSLSLNRTVAGDFDLQAVTQGSQLHLTGNSHFNQGTLALNGSIQLRKDYPANLSFQMDQFDADPLWHGYVSGNLKAHALVAGSMDLRGPLRQPEQWTVDGNLASLALNIENIKVQNQDPAHFSIAHQTLNIEQLHLVGDGTDLTVNGSAQLSSPESLDLSADGHADLKLLSTFDPNFTAFGLVTVNVTVAGTISDPFPQGRIQISNSSLAYAGLPSGLTELNGSLLFTSDHAHIENLAARTGGGNVDLKGDATFANQQLNFNLTATAKDVRMRYPPGVSSTADAQLNWVGSRSSSTFSGDILVNKIAITPGFDFSAYIDRTRQFTAASVANSPLNNIKLDVHVQTAPELQMRTAIARLSGDADLRLRGSLGHPAVLGRADILEGQATFHGTRFTLERGDITFANPVAIEPQLNLQASTRVRDYDLNITITGTPDRGFNVNYRSEPPLPKSDIISLLALGRTNGESAGLQDQSDQSSFSDDATAQILSQALNASVGNRLQRLFGASNIKIDPQGLTTETNPISNGPQITIEQEFVNHISLIYSTNVSQSSEQIIQGEYYVNRNISGVGTRDQNGVVSFDLRVRSRKK
jgi:translocation and assembly module TamB